MILEKAKQKAIALLLSLPLEHPEAELSISSVEDQLVWLGMGWLVGKGWAVYRGGFSFRLTPLGRVEVADLLTSVQ